MRVSVIRGWAISPERSGAYGCFREKVLIGCPENGEMPAITHVCVFRSLRRPPDGLVIYDTNFMIQRRQSDYMPERLRRLADAA